MALWYVDDFTVTLFFHTDAFDVTLEAHKVKNPDGLEVGRYWLKFSKGQILLISSAEYKITNALDACKPIAR